MTPVTEKTHAVLSPSGWARWSACPGSVEIEKPFPNRSSRYARDGTAMHEVAEQCILTGKDAEEFVDTTFVVEGDEIRITMEMADIVNEFVSYVGTFLDREQGDVVFAEQQVPLGHLTGEVGATGTSDVVGFRKRPDSKWTIVVIDLKTGQGVPVFAKDNGQLRMYALGAYEKFKTLYDVADVQMVIIQPPLNIVDDETLTLDQLLDFGAEVTIAAGRTQIGNAELVPGEKQCKFCRAKSTCPALRDEVLATVAVSTPGAFRNLDSDPTQMPKLVSAEIKVANDGELLAAQMRSLKLVEDWMKAVRAEVERRLFEGQPVPGFKVVQGKAGNRQWQDADAALALLKKVPSLKIDDVAPRAIVSPTAAEKLMKGDEKRWSKIAPLITQAQGKPSVAPISDPRPEYAVVSTAESFAALPAPAEERPIIRSVVTDAETICELSASDPLTHTSVEVSPETLALLS